MLILRLLRTIFLEYSFKISISNKNLCDNIIRIFTVYSNIKVFGGSWYNSTIISGRSIYVKLDSVPNYIGKDV